MIRTVTARTALLASALWLSACGGTSSSSAGSALKTSKGAMSTSGGGIAVNGVAFSTAGAAVTVEGQPATAADLRAGMLVKVKGQDDGVAGQAVEIQAEDRIRGKVSAVAGNVVLIGDRAVEVEDATEFQDNAARLASITPGVDRVGVSGFATWSGSIRASRIDKLAGTSDDFEAKGFVSGLSLGPPARFDLRVTPDAATAIAVTLAAGVAVPAGLANGAFVEISAAAAPAAGAVTATAVQLEDVRLAEAQAQVEVEGIVTSGTSASFMVNGQAVATDATTRFENGAAADLAAGVKVEVEGSLDAQVPPVLRAAVVSFRANVLLQGGVGAIAIPAPAAPRLGSFKVLGLTVVADALTQWVDFNGNPQDLTTIGTGPVLVRGMRSRDGSGVVASRIEVTGDTRLLLQGTVTAKNATAGTLVILGLTVATGAGTELRDMSGALMGASGFFAAVVEGRTVVKARGRDATALSGTTLAAEQVEIEGDH